MNIAYLISTIEDYGKFVSILINRDVSCWRLYWDERKVGSVCYIIDWREKRCYYGSLAYCIESEYRIIKPKFVLDKFGNYHIEKE